MPADAHGLEERKISIEERKIALEESFPRKWGSVISGAFAALIVAVITLGFNVYQYIDQSSVREQENSRKNIEVTRSVIDLYFRSVQSSSAPEEKIAHLAIFSAVANNSEVSRLFLQMRESAVRQTQKTEGISIVEAAQRYAGLPNNENVDGKSIYTVYIQYKIDDEEAAQKAKSLRDRLNALGYWVPAIDSVKEVPDKTTLRFYTAAQKRDLGASLMSAVRSEIGAGDFGDEILQKANLPADTLEIWVGRKATVR